MAIFTFSTRGKRPDDTAAVEEAKQFCENHNLNFSAIVTDLVKAWLKEQKDVKGRR